MARIDDITDNDNFKDILIQARDGVRAQINRESKDKRERAAMAVIASETGEIAIVYAELVDYTAMSPKMAIEMAGAIINQLIDTRLDLVLEHMKGMSESLGAKKY